jgi:hypothetical protein
VVKLQPFHDWNGRVFFFTVGPTFPKADQPMITQTIRRAATLYRTHFLAIAALVIVVWLPLELVGCYLDAYVFGPEDFRRSFTLARFFDSFIGIIATAAVISVGAAGWVGERPSFGSAIKVGLTSWWSMWWSRFLAGILIVVGFVCLIIPGIYLFVRLILVEPIAVCDRRSGAAAIRRSFELTQGRFWKVFGISVLAQGILLAGCACLWLPSFFASGETFWLFDMVSSLACDLLVAFYTICVVCVYFALAREEFLTKSPASVDSTVPPPLPPATLPDGSALDAPRGNTLIWASLVFSCLLVIGFAVPYLSEQLKPRFPWDSLTVKSASLHSSLVYNPYSDYPPRHRCELGITFNELGLRPNEDPVSPFVTFTVDLDQRGWKQLPGTHDMDTNRGSDFWFDSDNLGPVDLRRLVIRNTGPAKYELVARLNFQFENGKYRVETREFTFPVEYEGLKVSIPIWNEPGQVRFPDSWRVPSTAPHWSAAEVKAFLGHYIDLSQFGELQIDNSGSNTMVSAAPE